MDSEQSIRQPRIWNLQERGKPFQQDFDAFYARRDELADWINEYSPYSLVTKEDAPVYLFYDAAPAIGKERAKDPTHSASFGLLLQEKLNESVFPASWSIRARPR